MFRSDCRELRTAKKSYGGLWVVAGGGIQANTDTARTSAGAGALIRAAQYLQTK